MNRDELQRQFRQSLSGLEAQYDQCEADIETTKQRTANWQDRQAHLDKTIYPYMRQRYNTLKQLAGPPDMTTFDAVHKEIRAYRNPRTVPRIVQYTARNVQLESITIPGRQAYLAYLRGAKQAGENFSESWQSFRKRFDKRNAANTAADDAIDDGLDDDDDTPYPGVNTPIR